MVLSSRLSVSGPLCIFDASEVAAIHGSPSAVAHDVFGHHTLRREQRLPGPPEEVFPFFADAGNLEAITPPWLRLRVVTPRPIEMRAGALIEYRLALHGLPIRWLTRIEEWVPGVRFVDAQLTGPYRLWHHTHEFAPDGAGGTADARHGALRAALRAARRGSRTGCSWRATCGGSSTTAPRRSPGGSVDRERALHAGGRWPSTGQ